MKITLITLALALAAFAVQAGSDKPCCDNKAACADKNKAACAEKAKAAGGMCSSVTKQALLSPKAADAKR